MLPVKNISIALLTGYCLLQGFTAHAQQELETGGQKPMPAEWIDKDTHHKVIRLTDESRSNLSFYFHNNPFVGNRMVYYSSAAAPQLVSDRVAKVETYNGNTKDKQLYVVDLTTHKAEPITHQSSPMNGEIVGKKGKNVFYQIKDSVFCTNIDSKKTKLIYVFPGDFKASITSLNADETLLGGAWATDKEKDILKANPNKSDYFNKIYESKQLRTLFTVNVKTGVLTKLFSDTAWLNHVQFSPTDPNLLMFCHEGPWHKVDRIWTIELDTRKVKLMHKRTMNMEIAGHEWFSPDGKTIYYDLQQPRSTTFFVGGTDVKTGVEKKYSLTRNEWSIHFNISPDQKLFCGDGGDPGQVAKAPDGEWLYLFRPEGDKFVSEKLVHMNHHNYHLEPNVHFSPDGKWIIFRANFEGIEQVYAVEIKKS
ncbi:MAG TPA: oligogalacturonate lyase family protein [Chitinophagaceae bacterium]|jgi:oligogalacturonide lyase